MNDWDPKNNRPSGRTPDFSLPESYTGEASPHPPLYWITLLALLLIALAAITTEIWEGGLPELIGALSDGGSDEIAVQPESHSSSSLPAEALDLPAEQMTSPEAEAVEEILPPEDATPWVQIEEHPRFTTYRFTGKLSDNQILDIQSEPGRIWIGTNKGLLEYDLNLQAWTLFGAGTGIPGSRVGPLALVEGWVVMDTHVFTGPHSVSSRGIHRFDPLTWNWEPLMTGFVWDLYWDGANLWVGTASGVEMRDITGELVSRLTPENSGLLQKDVHATRRWGDDVWFAMLGDYQKKTEDFLGGGVSRLDLVTEEWRNFGPEDGLIREYSCDLAVDDREVWVAHWNEEVGLSRLDLLTDTWTPIRHSSNGIEIGGVILANDGDTLWVGQQRGLVELDKVTHRAELYREKDGLPGYIVSGIVAKDDAVWVSAYSYGQGGASSAGIVRIRK